jgi:hypothetical protein
MTGSAPGPAKVATRMVLLRMGFIRAPHKSYPASRAFPAWGQDGEYSLVGAARQSVASREGEAQDARRRISVAAFGRPNGSHSRRELFYGYLSGEAYSTGGCRLSGFANGISWIE